MLGEADGGEGQTRSRRDSRGKHFHDDGGGIRSRRRRYNGRRKGISRSLEEKPDETVEKTTTNMCGLSISSTYSNIRIGEDAASYVVNRQSRL